HFDKLHDIDEFIKRLICDATIGLRRFSAAHNGPGKIAAKLKDVRLGTRPSTPQIQVVARPYVNVGQIVPHSRC
ncbi:MAG: hypothetical protein P8Y71_20255, partial [Pseudolabrys sp.]